MKFARRAEGIKSARTVFKKAREDIRSRYHVFVAAALMEYYCSKDKEIAFRIFELGLKKFGGNPEYVKCYVDYLSHLNGKLPLVATTSSTQWHAERGFPMENPAGSAPVYP